MKYTAENYKYQLKEDLGVQTSVCPGWAIADDFMRLGVSGYLTIKSGYAWDGASGPTIDTRNSMRAGLVHDALYQLMRNGNLPQEWREAADREFYRILRADGMWTWRAWIWWRAVRRLAAPFARPDHRRKVLTAP